MCGEESGGVRKRYIEREKGGGKQKKVAIDCTVLYCIILHCAALHCCGAECTGGHNALWRCSAAHIMCYGSKAVSVWTRLEYS